MIIKHIINLLPNVENGDLSILFLPASLIMLNFIIFDNVTWRSMGYIVYKYLPVIKNNITRALFKYVLGLSHQFFQDNLSGRLSNQITRLSDNIERMLYPIIPNLFRGSSLVIIALISAYYVNQIFFWVILLWFVLFVSFSVFMSKKIVALSDSYAKTESFVSGQLVDVISNVNNIRIFSKKDFEAYRIEGFLGDRLKAYRKEEFLIIIMCIIQGVLISLMLGSVSYLLVFLYGKKLVTIGDFALILGLAMELGHMVWWTMSSLDEFNKAAGICKQSLDSLIVPCSIKDKENAKELVVNKGEITFNNVKFHYKETDLLFKNKSITIKGGQKVGLVGYSGSGKSTFVNLILRLYDVTEGEILIDGQNIRECTQDSLRKAIGMIPQDPSLFHRSLMENICYGKVDAKDIEAIEASKKAHAHEFISKLPERYDSLVGERGIKLSGGERQRIAIARSILKNAPILILDEATSQLDSVTEKYIQESLIELMQDKTTIVIAHRLSTLLNMDRIIVFDHGKIVEDGTHNELLKKSGLYKTLWNTQVGGFLPDKKD
jgi:ATP-binding cassette subfamily B protein